MYTIKITIEELRKHDACDEGLALFKSTYGDSAELEMTVENIVKLCTEPFKNFYIWAAHKRLVPWYNLRNANLEDANLRSANLEDADLEDANLRSANLEDANLRSANLRSANLEDANLEGADLRSADLRSADLRSANLEGADLRSANLEGADLRSANLEGADLRSANLRGAWYNEDTRFPNGLDLSKMRKA